MAVLKPEAKAPRAIDRDGPLSPSLPLQSMESNAFQWADLIEAGNCIKNREAIQGRIDVKAWLLPLSRFEEPTSRSVAPRLDHEKVYHMARATPSVVALCAGSAGCR